MVSDYSSAPGQEPMRHGDPRLRWLMRPQCNATGLGAFTAPALRSDATKSCNKDSLSNTQEFEVCWIRNIYLELFTVVQICIYARILAHVFLGFSELVFIISERSDSEESDDSFNCLILWVEENRLIFSSCFLFIEYYVQL